MCIYIYIYIWFANVTCCFVVFHSSFVQRLHDFYWLLRTTCWKFCGSMSCSDMLLLDSFKKKTCSKVEVEATRTRSLYTYSYLMTDQYIDIYKTSPFVEHCSTNGCKLFQYAEILHLCFFFRSRKLVGALLFGGTHTTWMMTSMTWQKRGRDFFQTDNRLYTFLGTFFEIHRNEETFQKENVPRTSFEGFLILSFFQGNQDAPKTRLGREASTVR